MHAKTVGRLSGIFGLAVAFVAVNATAPLAVTPAKATQVSQTALPWQGEAAQLHLDRFFEFALSPAASRAVPRVQVAHEGALVWIAPKDRNAETLSGRVVEGDGTTTPGTTITFTKDQVQDWTFIGRDSRIYGSFRTRAQLSSLSPQTAAPLLQVLSISSTPANW